MLTITAEVDAGLLDAMLQQLEQPRALLEVAGEAMIEYQQEVFATQGFGSWEGNDPVTVAEKGSGRVLVDMGNLLDELTSPGSLKYSGDTVTLSTSHLGAVMAKRGARGAPVRNASPPPQNRHLEQWADRILGALVGDPR